MIGRKEADGYRVATIYHSHIDTGAYFSETDTRNALIDGEPAYPDAAYVVVSVVEGKLATRPAPSGGTRGSATSPPSTSRPVERGRARAS